MGIWVEKRHKGGVVEVWLVNSSPHPESIIYGGETYVLGARSEALVGTEPAPEESPSDEAPTGNSGGGKKKGSKR